MGADEMVPIFAGIEHQAAMAVKNFQPSERPL
jgi:hypothetical protein